MNQFHFNTERMRLSVLHRQLGWTNRSTLEWSAIIKKVETKSPSVIGLDIFDTVLVRRVLGDSAAASAVARRMVSEGLWPDDVDSYLLARAAACKRAPDAPLTEWLSMLEGKGLRSAAAALELEIATENELLETVPGVSEALDGLRQIGPIIFVSDMHLSSGALRSILASRLLIRDSERLTVSCEAGVSKSDGGLFARAFDLVSPAEPSNKDGAVFVGNNPWADVTRAASAGITPIPAFGSNPTRFEEAFAVNGKSAGPAIAAAARMQRLRSSSEDESDQIAKLAAQVIGQINVAFLLWVHQQSQELGIRHLEFLARDGELPLRMAKVMPMDHWENLSLNYLQCGRRAWSLAAAPLVGVQEWVELGAADNKAFLLHSGTKIPFSSILQRCNLSVDDLPHSSALRSVDPSQPLSTDGKVSLYGELLKSGALNRRIEQQAQRPLSLILRSLHQRGLPAESIAAVDVGWRGQQAFLISAIIREATGHEPVHLHFGGSGVSESIDAKVHIERFALDDSIHPHPIDAPVSCLEMFLGSGKARLRGYRESPDGSVDEVFDDSPTAVDNPAQRSLWRGAIEMARLVPTRSEFVRWGDPTISLREETREVLHLFWNQATAEEVAILEDLRFEGDDAGDSLGRVLRAYSPGEVLGRSPAPRQWQHGSLEATAQPFRSLMKAYFGVKRRL